jgi:demethylmenaquinone methyltransferase/2-methoxy-6-polyprenyl-1,4-benzoquinol methylase
MFADIAPRYDLLNHLLSFNVDRGWRKALLRRLMPILQRPGTQVLDLCCGTGDVLLALQSGGGESGDGGRFLPPDVSDGRR